MQKESTIQTSSNRLEPLKLNRDRASRAQADFFGTDPSLITITRTTNNNLSFFLVDDFVNLNDKNYTRTSKPGNTLKGYVDISNEFL